jgi:hypothetical protein
VANEEFFKRQWKQGSFLPKKLIDTLIAQFIFKVEVPIKSEDLVILVSHDCDINYQGPFKKEPFCEIVIARSIRKGEKPKRHGKSLRYFQFQHSNQQWFELWSAERFFIPRESLGQHDPDGQLSSADHRRLRYWMSNRYQRAAFPNAFERRLDPKRADIEKCLKEKGLFIKDIYFRVPDLEIENKDEPYKIFGLALMDDDDYENLEKNSSQSMQLMKSLKYSKS